MDLAATILKLETGEDSLATSHEGSLVDFQEDLPIREGAGNSEGSTNRKVIDLVEVHASAVNIPATGLESANVSRVYKGTTGSTVKESKACGSKDSICREGKGVRSSTLGGKRVASPGGTA